MSMLDAVTVTAKHSFNLRSASVSCCC